MREFIWSSFAEKQMDEIHRFYLTKNIRIANRIATRILIATDSLKHNPKIGQLEPALLSRDLEYRYILELNYKLIYTINEEKNQVRITDVFDTRQSPTKIKRSD